jgi:hypothetical protein
MSVVEGIDVSGWQHPAGAPILWESVAKAGKRFVIVKATQGTAGLNSYLHADATGAAAAGLLVGVYHYATPNAGDAGLQAEFFYQACQGLNIDLGYWLDLETFGTLQFYEVGTWAEEFLAALKEKGVHCGPYLNDNYLKTLSGAPWGYPLWLSFSDIPDGVSPDIHQGLPISCPGIIGQVDPDVLLSYRGLEPPKAPAPAPGPQPMEDDVAKLVQVAGEAAVYLVGGVPVVKQHVSPEQETALIGLGTPKQVITQPEWLAAIADDNGTSPVAEDEASDPLGTTEKAGTTDTPGDAQTPAESASKATDETPTAAATADSGSAASSASPGPDGEETKKPSEVVNPGWQ